MRNKKLKSHCAWHAVVIIKYSWWLHVPLWPLGTFWLSMDDFDAGYLYQCKFYEEAELKKIPSDERYLPCKTLPVSGLPDTPIRTMHFRWAIGTMSVDCFSISSFCLFYWGLKHLLRLDGAVGARIKTRTHAHYGSPTPTVFWNTGSHDCESRALPLSCSVIPCHPI